MKKLLYLLSVVMLAVLLLPATAWAETASGASLDADARLQELRGETATDEELIKGTVSLLFDVKCDQLTGTGKEPFDYSNFWAPEADKKDGLQYFEDRIALRKGLLAKNDAYFYDTEEILTFQEVTVSGDRASVSFYEWFKYMDSRIPYNDIITDSGEGLDYRFELVKQDGVWYITAIDFDDWTTEPLKNGEMTVEEMLGAPGDEAEPEPVTPTIKSGSKTYTHHDSDGAVLWTATLSASFRYDGNTALCLSSSLSLEFSSGSYFEVSRHTTKLGNIATVSFTVGHRVLGITVSQTPYTLTLSCDRDGYLS